MGLSERLEKAATEKERKRRSKGLRDLFIYLENFEVEGLNEILFEIKDLKESGFYENLINSSKIEMNVNRNRVFTLNELLQVRILKLARNNLRFGGILTTIFTNSMITAKQFLSIYSFIEFTYCIFAGRPTEWNDGLNIYFSGLDERIIFALDQFDEVNPESIPEPTTKYFQMLRKIKWKNKKAKKLYDKLTELMFEIMDLILDYPNIMDWDSEYRSTEDLFIKTIAACSAVNDNRLEIEAEDVVMAYRTFFKLIKTDVTKYKAIPERIVNLEDHVVYLVCKSCGTYYQIPEGESWDDYSDTCECGGKLKYLGSPST